ncbi:MAG: hypothetical protein QM734_14410 [Cyclobacteriaceae bacterium]
MPIRLGDSVVAEMGENNFVTGSFVGVILENNEILILIRREGNNRNEKFPIALVHGLSPDSFFNNDFGRHIVIGI